MKADLTAWALLAAGILTPLAAQATGLSFVLRDIDGGPYFLMSPLWFIVWQPLVFIGQVSRNMAVLVVGLTPSLLIGGGLLLGSFVQLPLALIAPSDAIADMPRLEIVAMHAAAMLTGAAGVGLAAHVLSHKKTRSLD